MRYATKEKSLQQLGGLDLYMMTCNTHWLYHYPLNLPALVDRQLDMDLFHVRVREREELAPPEDTALVAAQLATLCSSKLEDDVDNANG
jgi:hypothetical protein